MVRFVLLILTLYFFYIPAIATPVNGKVTDSADHPLAYSSLYIKGTTTGTNANAEGKFTLDLQPGHYTLICEFLGYQRQVRDIVVGSKELTVDFKLLPEQFTMKEIMVRSGGEDPAYAIIRHAIKMREYYYNQVKAFTCNDYIKTVFSLRNAPLRFMGQKVSMEGLDTSRKGIVFLSESQTRLSVRRLHDYKLEVLSARESGDKSGYGFNIPAMTSFYQNIIDLGGSLSPRGFISPIASDAIHYYKYQLEGVFYDDGHRVNRIQVTPRRKFEPLFSGYIEIMDSSWRIRGLDLALTKTSGLQLLDTLNISQLYIPAESGVWMPKTEILKMDINLLGFEVYGNLVDVYSDYRIHPVFPAGFFGKVIMAYDSGSNRKSTAYWDTLRPVPLSGEEVRDYDRKDSLEKLHQSKRYVDSIEKRSKRVSAINILFIGTTFPIKPLHLTLDAEPLISEVQFNTVEGLVLQQNFHLRRYFFGSQDSSGTQEDQSAGHFEYNPFLRYGFSNRHFNAGIGIQYHQGVHWWDYERSVFSLTAGKQIFQFDNSDPIMPILNTAYSLIDKENFEKIYDAWFANLSYHHRWDNGFELTASLHYQNRIPLFNTTDYTWSKSSQSYTPNIPDDPLDSPFVGGKAVTAVVKMFYQPGQRFIQYPDHRQNISSNLPVFGISYSKGIQGVFGSGINDDIYKAGVFQNINLKLLGRLSYTVAAGGFLNSLHTQLPDLQQFNGNQTLFALPYMTGFQLAPYYAHGNTAPFYLTFHSEYHLNSLLTNKIPLFRKLNWWLVGATNAFYINPQNSYFELSAGLENILKLIRVDAIVGYRGKEKTGAGIRIGISPFGSSDSRDKFEGNF